MFCFNPSQVRQIRSLFVSNPAQAGQEAILLGRDAAETADVFGKLGRKGEGVECPFTGELQKFFEEGIMQYLFFEK